MKPIYRVNQYENIPKHILHVDYDFTQTVEPMLTKEVIDHNAVVEYLAEKESMYLGWFETSEDEFLKKEYYMHYLTTQRMREKAEMEAKELRLQLRVLELIHKYNLTDELED